MLILPLASIQNFMLLNQFSKHFLIAPQTLRLQSAQTLTAHPPATKILSFWADFQFWE